jgi:hypothetical protein
MGLAKRLRIPQSQSENPQVAPCGFSFGLTVSVVSVQPLANVIANHARHNRNPKVKDYLHSLTSLLLKEVRQRIQYTTKKGTGAMPRKTFTRRNATT